MSPVQFKHIDRHTQYTVAIVVWLSKFFQELISSFCGILSPWHFVVHVDQERIMFYRSMYRGLCPEDLSGHPLIHVTIRLPGPIHAAVTGQNPPVHPSPLGHFTGRTKHPLGQTPLKRQTKALVFNTGTYLVVCTST